MPIEIIRLGDFGYFSGMGPEELDHIKQLLIEERVSQGETFLSEGEPCESLYFLVSGAVKVFRTSADGKILILNIVNNGHALNAPTIYGKGICNSSMQALSQVTIYKIIKRDLIYLIKKYPQLGVNALSELAGDAFHTLKLAEDLSFNQVILRLVNILLKMDSAEKTWPRLTQNDLASMISTSRKTVNRVLKQLEDLKLIRVDRYGITIIDKTQLEIIAKPI
jgi:CRP/FNR family cyclic AMP-dependent transcriptional regulator